MSNWFSRHIFAVASSVIDGWAWLSEEASAKIIDEAVTTTRNRPHPWSTFSDYTSWQSLTDRTYLARHLPPASVPVQPPGTEVQKLFQRPAGAPPQLSTKSTCLFPAFAQYLTDGFIRTDPTEPRRTTTNHEIDLCPLYGRTPAQTDALRLKDNTQGRRGKLKSQIIGAEEFPPYLYPNGNNTPDPQFAALDAPLLVRPGQPPLPQEQLDSIFAVGGDRVNTTPFSAMMNTLLLREHNRVAHELEIQKPGRDDERVFQTARNIMIPMFIKIVVEQYINHITPLPFSLRANSAVAWTANWNRPNWITAEFSLLYRWHSLMPDSIDWPGGQILIADFQVDNRPLVKAGLDAAFAAAARQPAGRLGAFNTADALIDIEIRAVMQARLNRLDTYTAIARPSGWSRRSNFLRLAAIPMSSRC
jgi:prostaglandin-endoperoxide synthase 2